MSEGKRVLKSLTLNFRGKHKTEAAREREREGERDTLTLRGVS